MGITLHSTSFHFIAASYFLPDAALHTKCVHLCFARDVSPLVTTNHKRSSQNFLIHLILPAFLWAWFDYDPQHHRSNGEIQKFNWCNFKWLNADQSMWLNYVHMFKKYAGTYPFLESRSCSSAPMVLTIWPQKDQNKYCSFNKTGTDPVQNPFVPQFFFRHFASGIPSRDADSKVFHSLSKHQSSLTVSTHMYLDRKSMQLWCE